MPKFSSIPEGEPFDLRLAINAWNGEPSRHPLAESVTAVTVNAEPFRSAILALAGLRFPIVEVDQPTGNIIINLANLNHEAQQREIAALEALKGAILLGLNALMPQLQEAPDRQGSEENRAI